MKYYLDSAKIEEIREAYETFGIDGVTTNPNHIMKSGKPFKVVLQELADFVKEKGLEGYEKFPISVETNPHVEKAEDIIAMGKEIHAMCPNFVVKIACTEGGITAARKLEQMGIRTNLTLVFTPSQAIIAAKNGSLFVSPFIGWKESSGEDCSKYISDICQIYKNYGYLGKTQIICAAIRTGKQIAEYALYGADIVTAGLQVYKDSFYHPYTDYGIKKFTAAWDNTVTE